MPDMLLEIESSPTGIRVVVPARNAEWCIQACVSGLLAAGFTPDEVVVVDDGSTDATVALAQEAGVAVVSHPVVHADARARLIDFFSTQPGIDAVFGAYDERPACRNPTSIYRNLLHHYVHCQAPERPRSFWTGCGAVRREAFERLGGFDERQRMMEDVEFGIRLTQSGGVVALYSRLRGKHLKSFSVLAMARSDLLDRAIPWTRLMLFGCGLTAELNLDRRHRLSAALTALLVVSLIAATGAPVLLALTAACAAAFVSVNRDFLFLVQRCAGRRVALAAVPLHALHYCCALAGFSWVFAAEYLPRRALAASARAESPPIEVPTPSQSA